MFVNYCLKIAIVLKKLKSATKILEIAISNSRLVNYLCLISYTCFMLRVLYILIYINCFFFVLTRFITLRGLCEIYTTSASAARTKRSHSACSSLFIAPLLSFIILRKFFIRGLYEFAFLSSLSFFSSSSDVVI